MDTTRIEEIKREIAEGNPQAMQHLEELVSECRTEADRKEMEQLADVIAARANAVMDDMQRSIEEYTLREKLGPLGEALNIAYIARHYFGKSKHWLYQRLKGSIVNGKRAKFSPDEKRQFDNALRDIGMQISAFTE